nr:general transcription factor 3C polypeptide 4 [Naematelia aurantialba]
MKRQRDRERDGGTRMPTEDDDAGITAGPSQGLDKTQGSKQGQEGQKGPRRRLRRPTGGEMQFYITTIDYDREWIRDEEYGWTRASDSYGAASADLEVSVRSAAWSPSGMSHLGGCLLAVMLQTGQVFLYAPKSDPASKGWSEIVDLTMATKRLFGPGEIKIPDMLEMRATSMAWSPTPPVLSGATVGGSLLAVGTRAGSLALWSGLERVAHLVLTTGWISRLAWSEWRMVDDKTSRCLLAISLTDGSLSALPVDRITTAKGFHVKFGNLQHMWKPDKRDVTALQYAEGIFVWTKPGSVHLWADHTSNTRWNGVKSIRLRRIGNWAGANAILPCIGIQRDGDRLIVTLSSLTHYILTDLSTEPALAPLVDSLKLSVLAREAFIDLTSQDSYSRPRHGLAAGLNHEISAYSGGWTGFGSTVAWITEPINFHNLDSTTEGRRMMGLQVIELGSTGRPSMSIRQAVESILFNPPALIRSPPARVLFPIISRMTASQQDLSSELLELCAVEEPPLAGYDSIDALFHSSALDTFRLKLVLASWAVNALPNAAEFTALIASITMVIRRIVLVVLVRWAVRQPMTDHDDQVVLGLLRHAAEEAQLQGHLEAQLSHLPTVSDQIDRCMACGDPVALTSDSSTCPRGHRWYLCSVTNHLITTPTYRSCSTCPALSLLPRQALTAQTPGPISSGSDLDPVNGTLPGRTMDLAQVMLESAQCCVICGGRWTRSV